VTYLETLAQLPFLLTDGAIETRIHFEMGMALRSGHGSRARLLQAQVSGSV
jgi:hypothetical protein